MYACNSCGNTFENPVKRQMRLDARIIEPEEWNVCPVCGDDDYEELHKCKLCGTYILPKDDYCKPHQDALSEWMQDALERIQATSDADRVEVIGAMAQWIENQ